MVTTIARREFTGLWRDGRLPWAGGIVLALVVTALLVGWQRRDEVRRERNAAQALDYDDWVAQPERHPHNAAHQGMHVFRPDPPLSIVDPGIDAYVGSYHWPTFNIADSAISVGAVLLALTLLRGEERAGTLLKDSERAP